MPLQFLGFLSILLTLVEPYFVFCSKTLNIFFYNQFTNLHWNLWKLAESSDVDMNFSGISIVKMTGVVTGVSVRFHCHFINFKGT